MEIIAFFILALFGLVGFSAIFFTTFGTFLIFIGTFLFALLTGFAIITMKWLVLLLILYLAGEALEYIFIIVGTKGFGGSNWAVLGALCGGILGALLIPGLLGVSLIMATFLGVFLGACLIELFVHKNLGRSLKAATGSLIGRGASIIIKVVIALMMFIIIGYALIDFYLLL